ncbi:MAG: hypothetical protein ACHQ53_01465 [Polyangiales bacterium]
MRGRGGISAAMLGVALLATGCTSTVRGGLGEADANQIVVALDRAAIAATKREEPGGGHDHFTVEVAAGDLARALAVLDAQKLPRSEAPGFEALYEKTGLVATPAEERVRAAAATAGELARSLQAWPGVLTARVHIALTPASVDLDQSPASPKASVLVERRRDAPALDEAAIRTLVAGAIDSLAADRVTVVQVVSEPPPKWERAFVRVGPIGVTAGSAAVLKAILGGSLALDLLLAAMLVLVLRRR